MSTTPTPNPEAQDTSHEATAVASTPVTNKTGGGATGLLPKQLQTWIVLGLAALIVIGVWVSSGSAKKTPGGKDGSSTSANLTPAQPGSPSASGNGVSGLTPEDVQARLQIADRSNGANSSTPDLRIANAKNAPIDGVPTDKAFLAANAPVKPVDPLEEERRKRDFLAPYASNVAFSYRTPTAQAGVSSQAQSADNLLAQISDQPASTPELQALQTQLKQAMEQQQALRKSLGMAAPGASATASSAGAKNKANNVNVNAAVGQQHVLFEGTMLETVLVNRLNGDFSGPVICLVTNDLYSHDRRHVLIPAGTKVLGEVKKVSDLGQSRLAVAFHRLIMPDGYTVSLDQAPVLNQIGETALKDRVNNHYFKIFGSAVAIGAIAGFADLYSNTDTSSTVLTPSQAYREGVSSSLSQSSTAILNKFLNQLPTITIREGHRVKVFFTQDITLPAYESHRIASDI